MTTLTTTRDDDDDDDDDNEDDNERRRRRQGSPSWRHGIIYQGGATLKQMSHAASDSSWKVLLMCAGGPIFKSIRLLHRFEKLRGFSKRIVFLQLFTRGVGG